jgi:hypothetical protein
MENNDTISNLNDKLIDIELAKSDNRRAVKKFLPAAALAASAYYSILLASGLAIGYLASKLYAKYFLESGKVDSIYIDCGKWKIHLHHWISGFIFLGLAWYIDYFYLPAFFVGMVLGIIAHDIYDYNDWHKVLVKNEQSN